MKLCKIKILLTLVIFCLFGYISANYSALYSQSTNKKISPKQQNKKPKPKFPDKYSSLDNPKSVKTITDEMIENKIENIRQTYIKGLIVIGKQDTTEAIKYFETALIELNKLASYHIEDNEIYIELLSNVIDDYAAITKNIESPDLLISPKYKIIEKDSTDNLVTTDSVIGDSVEHSNYTKPPSADTSDKYIFAIPNIDELQIPMAENQAVERQIEILLKGSGRGYIPRWIERSSKWFPLMRNIAEKEGMPNELLLLTFIESGLNPTIESKAGALGLWQFMYLTGIDYNLNKKQSIYVDERRDPVKSTRAAMRYLRDLYLNFGDWYLALNAYNWGWGNVSRALRQCNSSKPTYWDIRNQKNINMPKEAREYVPLFLAVLRITSNPEEYGIDVTKLNYLPEFKFDILEIEQATNLSAIAQCIGVGIMEIKELNPELLYDITPPDRKYYPLRIPPGSGKNFKVNFAKLPDEIKRPLLEHKVGKNETIISVSEKYNVSIDELIKYNFLDAKYINLPNNSIIKIPIGGKTFEQSNLMLADNELVLKSSVLNANENYYVTITNESIYDIAEKHNISPAGIRNWNNIPIDQDTVEEGRTIVISGFEAEKNRLKRIENNNNNTKPVLALPEIITYKVEENDNLSNIAEMHNTTEKVIKELNPNIKNDNVLVGEILIIPNNNTTPSNANQNKTTTTNNTIKNTNKSSDVRIHTVAQGENLYRIALKYSTTVDKILSLNKDLKPDRISIGQKIRIK